MATLIPALGACVSRMTAGERRLAERLEQKLDDDYLLWYDVPMGPRYSHPDFCVMHPRRGILILEVKDWRLSTIQRADKEVWEILDHGISENVINSLAQARCPTGTRRRHKPRQARLPVASRRHVAAATRPSVNAAPVFDDSDVDAELPSIMRVMDLQQEQLARSLGDGHRVIHGVAGSGKTMILGYRAEYLAKAHTAASKPILILCYNEPLAVKLASVMEAKGLGHMVHARHFHKWCRDQLVAFGQTLPAQNMPVDAKMHDMVQRVIQGVDRKQIPSGQYQAVLIDEGHDFAPEWLRLVTQMVDPTTNSLLVLYDDAQSIYERSRSKQFSFKSVGIQAQGRTTILKINYRNTRQILHTASLIAADLLTADDKDDDGIPLLKPISCGRDGEAPLIIRLPNLRAEATKIADLLNAAHQEGHAWGDMAVICRRYDEMDECAQALSRWQLPHQVRKGSGSFNPLEDTIKVLTMHASKGLEFPVVALMGVGQMPAAGEDERDEARLFYVGVTRATQKLLVTVSGQASFATKLAS
jgi:DNA helicase IV